MKHFYHHLIATDNLFIEIDELTIEEPEKKQLKKLVHNNVHFTVMDIVLSELSERDKKVFLKHALASDHATTWQFLKKRSVNIENKITSAVETLLKEMHKDVKTVKK